MDLATLSRDEFSSLYEKHTCKELMSMFNVGWNILYGTIKRFNLSKRSKTKNLLKSISEDELRDLYLEKNLTLGELATHFNVSVPTIRGILSIYNIFKDRQKVMDNIQKTILTRYGVNNIRQSETYKQQAFNVKVERYGRDNLNNFEKRRQTCLEKYGFSHPVQSKSVSDKVRQKRWLNKTKEELQEIQKKVEETKLQRYGDKNYHNFMKALDTCNRKYGTPLPFLSCNLRTKSSVPNERFAELLSEAEIDFEREFKICTRSYDFKVGNILIEINPSATHNSTWGVRGKEGLSATYHYDKCRLAKEFGMYCIHVFDWDNVQSIISNIKQGMLPYTVGTPRKHYYNFKTKEHTLEIPIDNAVEIWDAGEVVWK